jgi:hypothetical protein
VPGALKLLFQHFLYYLCSVELRGALINRLRSYPYNLIRVMPAEGKRVIISSLREHPHF